MNESDETFSLAFEELETERDESEKGIVCNAIETSEPLSKIEGKRRRIKRCTQPNGK